MMNTKIVQKCGCYEGDCVEILGLEVPLYACFTCGYAGVTPSGADNPHEDEVHVHDLLAEVKRLREHLAYAASLIQCRIEGDDIPSSDIRDYLLEAVGMTIEEAMATTDLNLWGEEE